MGCGDSGLANVQGGCTGACLQPFCTPEKAAELQVGLGEQQSSDPGQFLLLRGRSWPLLQGCLCV